MPKYKYEVYEVEETYSTEELYGTRSINVSSLYSYLMDMYRFNSKNGTFEYVGSVTAINSPGLYKKFGSDYYTVVEMNERGTGGGAM